MLTDVKAKVAAPRLEHKDIHSYYVRFSRAEWGGLKPDTLVVVAAIPLDRETEGYDEAKVERLEKVVSNYVKQHHSPYAHIEFIQKG